MKKKRIKHNITQKQIMKILKENKDDILKCGVKRIGLFGSYKKGVQHAKSDMDFLVTFSKPGFDNYMDLKFMLEKLFGKKIDLVTEKSLKPALKYVKEEAVYAKI